MSEERCETCGEADSSAYGCGQCIQAKTGRMPCACGEPSTTAACGGKAVFRPGTREPVKAWEQNRYVVSCMHCMHEIEDEYNGSSSWPLKDYAAPEAA